MKVRIQHRTTYHYDEPALLGPHVIRLRPAPHARTPLLSYALHIDSELDGFGRHAAGSKHGPQVRWQYNPWGSREARVTFPAQRGLRELDVLVDCTFDIHSINPFDFFVDDDARELPFEYPGALEKELAPFRAPPSDDARLKELVASVPYEGITVSYLVAMNQRIASTIQYVIRMEPGVWSPEQTLAEGRGSCRDSAQLLVAAFRSRGLAARFVSGYLVQLADEGNIPDLAKGVSNDVVDLHAWCEVYLPGAGWIGLDGTSGLLCGEGHIPLAVASDPELAAAITGTSSEPATDFAFSMTVERLGHEPRPRKPYEDAQWQSIQTAGDEVDATLSKLGVKLTCGGEPTFTSREHPTEPEWATEALGKTKLEQGLRLAEELRKRFGTGTAVLHRMGKHYPGESLPRWAIDILWRADGAPIWKDPKKLALTPPRSVGAAQKEPTLEDAYELGLAVARLLGVPPNQHAAYEDPWHFVKEEALLPHDVDPHDHDLDAHEDRRRLASVLGRGLEVPVGWVLPLGKPEGVWVGDQWTFRRERLYLLPGDSPVGLRLPLNQLSSGSFVPWEPDLTQIDEDADIPFDPAAWLATRRHQPPGAQAYALQGIRTALCVEPRDGVLNVFLPPTSNTEDWLELVTAIEAVTEQLGIAVRLEGYRPNDPRMRYCTVTPDPGVIEVNVPVASSFAEYRDFLHTVTDAANHAGLRLEKYQLDGREVGSGGGNHLTLGGASAIESPFLTRPWLFAGLLRYVQNHPSLSYLFTGLFIGPTSQAPRIDEARQDALFELELALKQVPTREQGGWIPPGLTDRLFRNLLADVSGNTHRTEISIDKLYDPHNLGGRQGLVEFRAFEMPPHEQMACVQMLLVRAITARLVAEPYERPLIPWGTDLHDRWMLPHFLWKDACDVAADLRAHGVHFDAAWLSPFLELRFPVAGTYFADDVEIEIRQAGEPWYTLGEQPAGSVVARYVDSSVERLQVKVRGLAPGDDGRHVVCVNGVRLPLRETGTVGEKVIGVRFRAWQPPFCLQPTIPIQHPLRFDLVDVWGRRALGACTYHVWHPEGRGYDEPPLTAYEAKARRAQRFTTDGHSAWPITPRDPVLRPEAPYTLDLRWQ